MNKKFVLFTMLMLFMLSGLLFCYAVTDSTNQNHNSLKNVLFRKTNYEKMNNTNVNTTSCVDSATKEQNLQAQIKSLKLRETYATSSYGIYCEAHNPNKPAGDYTDQRHYYWDECKQKMVELSGIYYVSSDVREVRKMLDNYHKTGKMVK